MMLTRSNAPLYTDRERELMNAVAAEVVGKNDLDLTGAVERVRLLWFPGASAAELRQAVALHRDPLPNEPQEADWQ
jgi:hypothetical protein